MLRKREKLFFIILFLCFVITIIAGILIIRALPEEDAPSRQLTVHSTEIDCVVEDVEQGSFNLKVTVYNIEYWIKKTFVLTGKDAARFREVRPGDTVTGYIYYWTNGDELVDWVLLLYQIF